MDAIITLVTNPQAPSKPKTKKGPPQQLPPVATNHNLDISPQQASDWQFPTDTLRPIDAQPRSAGAK